MPLTGAQIAGACVAVALGALVQGSVGFGMALVAAPILFLIDPILVPGPLLCCGLLLTALLTIQERRSSHLQALPLALVGLGAGAALGATALTIVAEDRLSLLIGCLVLLAVLLSAAGLRVSTAKPAVFVASILAGFMGTTASIPGPPLALVYQGTGGARLRGTLSPLLFTSGLVSITALTAVGRFGAVEIGAALVLVPNVLVGYAASRFVSRWLAAEALRVAVLLLSGFSAVAVLLRSLG